MDKSDALRARRPMRGPVADRWHYEADRHPGRDGLTLMLVTALLFAIFVLIGYGLATSKASTDDSKQQTPAVEIRKEAKETEHV